MQQLQAELEKKHICHQCIGDKVLAGEVRCAGAVHPCSYCERKLPSLPLGEIAVRIHGVITEQFALTPDHPVDVEEFVTIAMDLDWERKGDPADLVIAEIAEVEPPIANDVANFLSEYIGWQEVRDGGEDPYGPEALHQQVDPDTSQFKNSWENFRKEIETQVRFFGINSEKTLSEIFADLQSLRTVVGEPVVREIEPCDEGRFVYRGRKALSADELYRILKSPASELGPPPSQFAAAGRMNSAGIPVFYGAQDRKVCVAEVRPPVGSRVVTGKFELTRTVRLLDLDRLERAFVETSNFDERYIAHYGRHAFLRQLVAEITAPVMPQDETKEYLATQMIADFLSFKVCPRLDGILFRSSQTDGSAQNVVLFNHASHVEPVQVPPGTSQEVSMPQTDDGFTDEDVIIFEKLDSELGDQSETGKLDSEFTAPDQEDEHTESGITPTVRFCQDSMVVHEVKKMEPEFTDLPVRRVPVDETYPFEIF